MLAYVRSYFGFRLAVHPLPSSPCFSCFVGRFSPQICQNLLVKISSTSSDVFNLKLAGIGISLGWHSRGGRGVNTERGGGSCAITLVFWFFSIFTEGSYDITSALLPDLSVGILQISFMVQSRTHSSVPLPKQLYVMWIRAGC